MRLSWFVIRIESISSWQLQQVAVMCGKCAYKEYKNMRTAARKARELVVAIHVDDTIDQKL